MVENSGKRDFPSFAPSSSENGDDRFLRRMFAAYDRFSVILTRFLMKELSIRPDAELQTVEKTTLPLLGNGESFRRPLFQIHWAEGSLPVFIELEVPFLFAAVDRILGSERFAPDHETESLTEIDRRIAELFIDRLTELIVGFSGLGGEKNSIPTQPAVWLDAFPSPPDSKRDNVYYLLTWNLVYEGEIFSFVLYLPSDVADHLPPAKPDREERTNADLFRYIEARKTERKPSSNPLFDHKPDVETGMAEVRVLVGTLEVTPDDLTAMSPGDILTTDIPATALFRVRVDGVEIFYGRPGEYRGENAVEIVNDVKKP